MSPLLLIGQNGKVSWPLQEHVCDFYQKLNDKITCRLFKTNINGGAIALGHPLGCTGCKLTIQNLHDMKRLKKKYGMVTACVGEGHGIAGVIENIPT